MVRSSIQLKCDPFPSICIEKYPNDRGKDIVYWEEAPNATHYYVQVRDARDDEYREFLPTSLRRFDAYWNANTQSIIAEVTGDKDQETLIIFFPPYRSYIMRALACDENNVCSPSGEIIFKATEGNGIQQISSKT